MAKFKSITVSFADWCSARTPFEPDPIPIIHDVATKLPPDLRDAFLARCGIKRRGKRGPCEERSRFDRIRESMLRELKGSEKYQSYTASSFSLTFARNINREKSRFDPSSKPPADREAAIIHFICKNYKKISAKRIQNILSKKPSQSFEQG